MLDGYSFAATREQLDEQFDDQKSAYLKIFNRAGVTVHPVIADSGTMGGKNSTELQLVKIQLLLMKKALTLLTLKWLKVLILLNKSQKKQKN